MLKRHIWSTLEKEINTDEVVVITGPRQVGKTTTLKWLLEKIPSQNKQYFDLENIVDRELFETKNYDSLMLEFQRRGLSNNEKMYIALDEIQRQKNVPSIVKYLYDHYKIKFFLTGSSSFYIKNHFSESMAGRKMIYEMFPLNFQEYLEFRGCSYSNQSNELFWETRFSEAAYEQVKDYYQEYIEFGGLPKIALTQDNDRKRRLLEEIYSSYIDLDVQALADFKSTHDLRRVIKLLAARIGNKLNLTEIANITGLSRITIDSYVEFLEQTYLIATVPAYSKSADVQTRLQKKLYFIDTGIANVNADLSSGSKFENAIRHQLSFWNGKLQYFSDRDGEIDFILRTHTEDRAFEVKETPSSADLGILMRRAKKLGITSYRLIGKEPPATFTDFIWGGRI